MKVIHYLSACCLFGLLSSCNTSKKIDFAISNVQLFDGHRAIKNATLLVDKGIVVKIDTVQSDAALKVKRNIDGTNKTLIPGLINAHCHLGSTENLKEAAQAGVLTMIELLRMQESEIPKFKKASKKPDYAYFFTAGIAADEANGVIKMYTHQINPFAPKTPEEATTFIQERVKQKVDFIKIIYDSRLPEKFDDARFDALIAETHRNNLLAVVHSELLKDAIYEFNHGADIIAHGWVDSLISDEILATWRSRPFAITPTLLVHCKAKKAYNMPSYKLSLEAIIAEIGRLQKAGIPILAGTDSPAEGLNYSTDLYEELALYVQAGLTPLEALKTATTNTATAYYLPDKGQIKTGGSADFVLIDGNVLSDITLLNSIAAVWKQGKRIR